MEGFACVVSSDFTAPLKAGTACVVFTPEETKAQRRAVAFHGLHS